MSEIGATPDPGEIKDKIKAGSDRANALKAYVDTVSIKHVHRQDIEMIDLVVKTYELLTEIMKLVESKVDEIGNAKK
ncbi:hypothetical protein LCGC14_0717910 [marine sediment metagenome]|uniref:Uncharacterized protein n=1 Tax=marine sediment metagenome TaxID=412755 RepID=A0A0F9QYD0_9ZZZZ